MLLQSDCLEGTGRGQDCLPEIHAEAELEEQGQLKQLCPGAQPWKLITPPQLQANSILGRHVSVPTGHADPEEELEELSQGTMLEFELLLLEFPDIDEFDCEEF